ncbi:uncharacterized protein LOC121277979 [Carcharodon carcharias]|uniref:uncharacterized protein LOC121277979 n=1 Tax=Carcharodon carcharias TaxID=13397 RepID=UPI001B7F1884|nr:uncharacterized protein LOC121277979 [Carcharodon carcharias]
MLCWGDWDSETGQKDASQTRQVLKGQTVQHVCSRDGFTVFVLENGTVYTRVCGRKKQTKPGPFTQFRKQKIHFVDSGTSHILFLSKAGTVFHSEVNSKKTAAKTKEFSIRKPQLLKSLSLRNIIQVACGNHHSLALSKDGKLFAWGQNTYGQLGLGTKGDSEHSPQCVTSLTGMPVAQITAGGEHSFALSLSGAVFGWGRNNHGQLGLKDTEDIDKPNYVKLLECKKTIHISCGEEHTAVLTKDGLVFTFGAGRHGQLGHNSTEDEIKPRLVGYLFGNKVSQIACGSYHTLVFVPSSGKIYSFGCGENGQLGNRETSDQLVPLPVNMMDTSDKNGMENGHSTKPAVRRIFAGGNQSFAECRDEVDLVPSVEQSSFNILKRIMTVDSLLEKELCKKTRRAIVQVFSSSQTLCGSFLDVSKDGHFKTNGEVSGLDMSAIYLGFEKLAKNSSMLEQVKAAVQDELIPSLPRSPACVETMRVYIILTQLVAVLEESMLTDSLNKAILSLEGSYFKILECWWSTMPDYFFTCLVRMYQKESNRLLQLAMMDISGYNSPLHSSLKILQALYKVNSSRCTKITERNFCIPVMEKIVASAAQWISANPQALTIELMNGNIGPILALQQSLLVHGMIQRQFITYPCIFDMKTKLRLLAMESKATQRLALELKVSRKTILQDALEGLRPSRSVACHLALQVRFKDEACYGSGVTQEFFTLFARELHSNRRLFQRSEDSELLWFPDWEPEMSDVFHLMGILCGLAVSNCFICNFHFPLALYKKLLHVQPTLEDLKELSPTEGNSLQEVLDYEYDDIEDMFCLDFTISKKSADGSRVILELLPGGSKIPVQKHNRKQYVDAYVDYKLNTSVKKQFEAFSQDFENVSLPIVNVFQPEELRDIIHGNTNYEWELLEQNAKYHGYTQTDKTIRNFWEVFENLAEEKKKQFLVFLSGRDRIPVGGIQSLSIAIVNTRSSEPDSSYPRAYTCTRTLDLPNYSSIEILREKLLHAMESSEEFNAQELATLGVLGACTTGQLCPEQEGESDTVASRIDKLSVKVHEQGIDSRMVVVLARLPLSSGSRCLADGTERRLSFHDVKELFSKGRNNKEEPSADREREGWGNMLCWGDWDSETGQKDASQTRQVLKGQRVQHVCSRDGFTVFVLENGTVYTRVLGRKKQTKPGPFTQFRKQKIHFVDSGTSHILFLSKAGTVFHSEVNSKETAAKTKEFSIMKPQLLKSLSMRNIIQVACGNHHSLALSKDGKLFAWGQNTYGQLGLGTKGDSEHSPQCVTSLTGMPVAQITAGGEHSFALSLSGAVFGWGRNNHGQLGLKDTEDRHKPNYVKLLECKKTVHISCGEEHTAVLTKDGLVFTFGAGSFGQLGHNSTEDEIKPRLVGYLFGNKVSQIACGSYHTLVFVPSSGKIYSFGCGENGQLGNRETSDRLVPLPVNMMDTSDNNGMENGHTTKPAVRRIFAGGDQSFAECRDEVDLVPSVDQSSFNTLKRIMTADSSLEKKMDKNTRKEIIRAFSSSQTLSGSFLDVSKDGHFKTNGEASGLDMSAIYLGFEKLAKNSSMLEQVKNAVQNYLIPSLPQSPACVETMRVYIILPELIAVLEELRDTTMLTDSLNKAILSLRTSSFKVLECWWSTMPDYFFKRLVRMYKKESNRLLQLAMEDTSKVSSKLHDSLKILQALYKINSSRCTKITERHFCIPVMENLKAFAAKWIPVDPQALIIELMNSNFRSICKAYHCFSAVHNIQRQLIAYPCIFNMKTKLEVLAMESMTMKRLILQIQVSRKTILQDTLKGLRVSRSVPHCLALQVQFKGEPCFGHGVSQELFTLFSRELHSNGQIFQRSEDSGLLWFPSWEPEMGDVFHLMGILCGLAVSNHFICNFHFPLALYKKLLHVQPTLEDLKELSPTEGNSLQEVLDYEYDDIEDTFLLDFTISKKSADGSRVILELLPDGSEIPVQKHNRKQYVDAYVDYKLNTSVKKQFEAFSQGFRNVSLPIVNIFQPEELRDVIHGNTNYEWELLEQNANYKGYTQTDKTIRNFWEVFENLAEEKKKQFLAFLSGSERIPVGGIQSFRITILNSRSSEPDSSYPRAYTCTRTLDLPNYSSIEILREKLLHAMEFSEEFNAQVP